MFPGPRSRNQLGASTHQDVPELGPVLVVLVDQKCYLGKRLNVSQARQALWRYTLGFSVDRRVEHLAIVCETHRHDVGATLRIVGCEPGHPGLLELRPNRI